MKRILRGIRVLAIAVVALVCSVNSSSAQSADYDQFPNYDMHKVRMEWGIGAHGSFTHFNNNSSSVVGIRPKLGLGGHIDMAVCVGRNFALEAEISYEGGSLKVETPYASSTIKTRTVDIPVLLSLRMADSRIRLAVGPLFTVKSNSEYSKDGNTMFFGPVYPTWNLAAGIGIGLSRHFILEARYIHALKDNVNQYNGIEFKTRASRVTAGITLFF